MMSRDSVLAPGSTAWLYVIQPSASAADQLVPAAVYSSVVNTLALTKTAVLELASFSMLTYFTPSLTDSWMCVVGGAVSISIAPLAMVLSVKYAHAGAMPMPNTSANARTARITAFRLMLLPSYCSSAERACDTVEIVTRGKLAYERTKGLKEFCYGSIEGNSYELVLPGTYNPYGDFLVPFGGDSEDEVIRRMRTTLTDIMERPGHESVLAVSHGACTRAFVSSCDATSTLHVPNRVAPNCSVHVFWYENGVFDLRERFVPQQS